MDINDASGHVVSSAMKVHTALGPGLLESAYEACMTFDLRRKGLRVRRQVRTPIVFDGHRINIGYKLDMLIDDQVVVELKAVSRILDIHHAQLLSYLKLGNYNVGLLLNFHVSRMKDGIVRFAN